MTEPVGVEVTGRRHLDRGWEEELLVSVLDGEVSPQRTEVRGDGERHQSEEGEHAHSRPGVPPRHRTGAVSRSVLVDAPSGAHPVGPSDRPPDDGRYPATVPPTPEFIGDHLLRIGDIRFHYEHPLNHVPPDHLGIEKVRSLLEAYFELWNRLRPRRVVELGIRRGGSTAMLCELGGAERIVSVELSATRLEALDRYVAARGVPDVVHPHYGVDQSDRNRLARIVDDEFEEAPLDLVIDDASHLYDESRASFEVLFPRLRPGGVYLLEDWRWEHMMAGQLAAALERDPVVRREIEARIVAENRIAPDTPMSRLVLELVVTRAECEDVVADVVVGPFWAAVRRGPAPLDPQAFRLDDHARDLLHVLTPLA